jgi:ABC-type Mn2+/Zn2+ transport system ATPase subunit
MFYRQDYVIKAGSESLFKVPELNLKGTGVHIVAGPNGCGKTTFLRQLAKDWIAETGKRNEISLVSALHHYDRNLPLSGSGFIDLYVSEAKTDELKWPNLFVENFAYLKSKLINEMSSGEFQALVLVANFLSKAQILLMDEPFSHLNPKWITVFNQYIETQMDKRLFVLVTHHHFEAEKMRPAIYSKWLIQDGNMRISQ